jgi:hypothetical protein
MTLFVQSLFQLFYCFIKRATSYVKDAKKQKLCEGVRASGLCSACAEPWEADIDLEDMEEEQREENRRFKKM